MSVLDLSLVKAPYGTGPNSPATINGVAFRLDPSATTLPIKTKIAKMYTLGGIVTQVYGVTWGDLTVTGQFGLGGWQEQRAFLDRMVSLGRSQSMQRAPTFAGQNYTPGQPFRFTWPLLRWDFLCYLKGYTSSDGAAVAMSNTIINPTYTLTLFVVTDNGTLTTVAQNAYIARLAGGLGVMWDSQTNAYTGYKQDQYNAPSSNPDVQAYINNAGGTERVVKTQSNVMSATLSGPVIVPVPNASTNAVGTPGKAVVAPPVGSISSPNDFSAVVLQELGVVPGTWSVTSPEAHICFLLLNAWQLVEGQWKATGAFNALQMHNPLNINAKGGYPYGYVWGIEGVDVTGSFPNWADGVKGTVALINSYPAIYQALVNADPTAFFAAVQPWAPGNAGYSTTIRTKYIKLGGTNA